MELRSVFSKAPRLGDDARPASPRCLVKMARVVARGLWRRGAFSFALLGLFIGTTGPAESPEAEGAQVVGRRFVYTAEPGDSLARIGARFAVRPNLLARYNGLPSQARLSVGQILQVENLHIVPFFLDEGILINVPQRILFLFEGGALAAWYPVGLGRADWQTATGRFQVETKTRRPTWHVPASIQREMRQHGETVRTEVPPGAANPLGEYWIGLTGSSCGIHGTNAPTSIYTFRTHGCIRLHPDDVADLFSRVSIGTPVWVVYEPVLLARQQDGTVFLEVTPDIYRRARNARNIVGELAAREGLAGVLDETRVAEVLVSREGVARRVDRRAETPGELEGRFR